MLINQHRLRFSSIITAITILWLCLCLLQQKVNATSAEGGDIMQQQEHPVLLKKRQGKNKEVFQEQYITMAIMVYDDIKNEKLFLI